jgi:hypothetical protein
MNQIVSTEPGADVSAPVAGATSGHLEFRRGASRVVIHGDPALQELFVAHFEGPIPEVDVADGTVGIRYRHLSPADWARLALLSGDHGAEIAVNASLPWHLTLNGGVSRLEGDLRAVRLTGIDVRGGASHVELLLGRPEGIAPIRVRGGVSHVTIWRPADVPVRAGVRGGISKLALDEQRFGAVGGETRLQTGAWSGATAGYDVEILGGASHLTIGSR